MPSLVTIDRGSVSVLPSARADLGKAVLSFLDAMATATGRSTFYNKRGEQQDALRQIHDTIFQANRGLYAALLMLPGGLDISTQEGVNRLLFDPYEDDSILTSEQESEVVRKLVENLPANRMFNLFRTLRQRRINNSRTRKIILRSILGNKMLPYWAVKYRTKMGGALRHAWGQKYATVILKILQSDNVGHRERAFIARNINRFVADSGLELFVAYEAIRFVLGDTSGAYTHELFRSFKEAKHDLKAGVKLPTEVLEGIRSRCHKDVIKDEVIKLTVKTMGAGKKVAVQRQAKKAKVEVKIDASDITKLDMVKLYVLALEEGMTQDLRDAIDVKAKHAAKSYLFDYEHIAVVVDNSLSMIGTNQQKYRPLAIALSMRDILVAKANNSHVIATNGVFDRFGLVQPGGDTSLAGALAECYVNNPQAIYIITDGYENAPAGRVNEVVNRVNNIGYNIPVFQITPVMASESAGVRQLSPLITKMPVSQPETLGLTMVRALLEQDVERGLQALINTAVPNLLTNEREAAIV